MRRSRVKTKAKGRFLFRDFAPYFPISKIWFGSQITTDLLLQNRPVPASEPALPILLRFHISL